MLLSPVVTIRVPSGLNVADHTSSGWSSVARLFPVRASQSRAVSSLLAVAMRELSGLNDADAILPLWPLNVATTSPVVESQILAIRSAAAVTILVPSGLNAAAETPSGWTSREIRCASTERIALARSEEHTSELQSRVDSSYAV